MVELTQAEKMMAEKSICVVLVNGIDPSDKPIWAYVGVRLIDLEKFMAAQKKPNFDPEEFGVILEVGEGLNPPGEIKEKMEKEYGFNHEKMLNMTNPPAEE